MTDNIRAHIGGPADMGQRFVDSWHRAERGEAVDEPNVTFRDLEGIGDRIDSETAASVAQCPPPSGSRRRRVGDQTGPQTCRGTDETRAFGAHRVVAPYGRVDSRLVL